MSNIWEKKMVEQVYNYLDGAIHSMAEFFETRIENLEKSIPSAPNVLSRNNRKSKKQSKKRKAVTFNDS